MPIPPSRFSTPEQRLQAQAVLAAMPATGALPPDSLDTVAEAAWHLRQTQSDAAAAAAQRVLQGVTDPTSGRACQAWARLTLAEWHWLSGRRLQAAADLAGLEALPAQALLEVARSDACWLHASLASDSGDIRARRQRMQQAQDLARQAEDAQRTLSCELALDCFEAFDSGGRLRDAVQQRAHDALQHLDAGVQALAHCLLSHCCMGRADYAGAMAHTQSSAAAARDCGQWRRALIDTCNQGSLLADLGDMDGCLAVLEPALAQARQLGWPALIGTCLLNLAQALVRLHRPQQGLARAQEAATLLEGHAGSKTHLNALYTLAEAAAACGEGVRARAIFESLSRQPQGTEAVELQRYAGLGLARLDAAEGQTATARGRSLEVLEQARAAQDRVLEVETLQVLAALALQQARDDASTASSEHARRGLQWLRQALDLAEQHGVPVQAALLMNELADVLAQAGETGEALAVQKRAWQALLSERSRSNEQKALAAELRVRTAQVQSELQAQRRAAEFESRRAAELQALNQTLTQTLQRLQEAQADLEQRNQALQTAQERIQELSLTDPLTGLRNRRHLMQAIPAVLKARQRAMQSEGRERPGLVFLLIDLDGFKRVNDRHGHAAGDAVLVQLAERLRASTRLHDDIVRWGGEEFLIVMQGLDAVEAPAMAERLRRAVADLPFVLPAAEAALQARLTTSVGWSLHPERVPEDQAGDWEDAITRADERMYRAKVAGGNRCQGPD